MNSVGELFKVKRGLSIHHRVMVLQLSLVKLVGGKLTNLWVHSVLLVQHYLVYVAVEQPFEETPGVPCFGMILGHHSWR